MADLPISELQSLPDTIDDENTLFVAQQGDSAFKVDGHTFITELAALLDAHGGIKSIVKTSTSNLIDNYTITFSDDTTTTFSVSNGKGISSITTYYAVSSSNSTAPSEWYTTMQTMTNTNRYLWSYQHFAYNDGTSYDSAKVVVGVYGEQGVQGETGAASAVSSQSIQYASSTSGTTPPSSGWGSSVPSVSPGNFLWTKVSVTFNDNTTAVWYSSARQGVNGIPGSESFQITLYANGWSSNAQTVSNAKFLTTGFYYVVTPTGNSGSSYFTNGVIANDVVSDGYMSFNCSSVPSSDLTVNILRVMIS